MIEAALQKAREIADMSNDDLRLRFGELTHDDCLLVRATARCIVTAGEKGEHTRPALAASEIATDSRSGATPGPRSGPRKEAPRADE